MVQSVQILLYVTVSIIKDRRYDRQPPTGRSRLERICGSIDRLITADGPNTDDLSIADFFALWAQFDGEREQRADIAQIPWKFSV